MIALAKTAGLFAVTAVAVAGMAIIVLQPGR